MTDTDLFLTKDAGDRKPQNLLAGSIYIAIRDAEIHGTKLAISRNGRVEHLTPDEMRRFLAEEKNAK